MNLLVLAVVLATLAKFVVVLKLGLNNISKSIANFIFLNIYATRQDAMTHIILFVFFSKKIMKLSLNSTEK